MRKPIDISGQWVGYGTGYPEGDVVVDLDPMGDEVVGTGYLFLKENFTNEIPSTAIQIRGPRFTDSGLLDVQSVPFDARIGYILSKDEIYQHFPNATIPKKSQLRYEISEDGVLHAEWSSDIGTHGKADLRRTDGSTSAGLHVNPDVRSWSEFKEYISKKEPRHNIYRGQSEPYSLQTSFHRTGRTDLVRYLREDVPILHRALSARVRHFFDMSKGEQVGAFLNLAQHHGFPTPLLDWSYSPYVAAYFAFSKPLRARDSTGSVRIFCLDKKVLTGSTFQFQHITHVYPHLSILEALSIENERAIPQQGLATVTNLQDIERYLNIMEVRIGKNILTIIDLPKSEARLWTH